MLVETPAGPRAGWQLSAGLLIINIVIVYQLFMVVFVIIDYHLMVFFGRFLVVLALVGASVAERRLRGNAQPRDEVRMIISIWIWISPEMKCEYLLQVIQFLNRAIF